MKPMMGRPTRFDPAVTLAALEDARTLFEVWADDPEAVLDQLLHYYEGRTWTLGESGAFSPADRRTCLELEGVYSWTDQQGQGGARQLISKWMAHAIEAIREHRSKAK